MAEIVPFGTRFEKGDIIRRIGDVVQLTFVKYDNTCEYLQDSVFIDCKGCPGAIVTDPSTGGCGWIEEGCLYELVQSVHARRYCKEPNNPVNIREVI